VSPPSSSEASTETIIDALVCPLCDAPLRRRDDDVLHCGADARAYPRRDGVWRLLAGEPEDLAERFVTQYREVRQAEGWGAADDAHYRALPFKDTSGRYPEIWRIRAVTYNALIRRVFLSPPLVGAKATVLDLGAGNCWLSFRLAGLGHRVAAVDVNDDPRDGLGAHVHYGDPAPFVAVQASFERLPWPDGYADLIVFNGSVHYSANYSRTLREACRVLRPGGRMVLIDSPFYQRASSGEQMVRERAHEFRSVHGAGFEPAANEAFLTRQRLDALGDELGIDWQVTTPFYGLRWTLRPLLNRLRRRREPARFHLVVGSVKERSSP